MANQNPNAGGWQSTTVPEASKLAGQASKAAEQIASSAIERVQDVRDKAESGLSKQRNQVTDRIRRVSEALRTTSEELRIEDEFVAGYLDQAGDRVESLASYVSDVSPSDIARDVQRFATERPAWFFGGTFLLGLAVGRFLKSTAPAVESSNDYRQFASAAGRYAQPRTPEGTYRPAMGTAPGSTPSTLDRPVSSAGYSEPRVYGTGSSGTTGASTGSSAGTPSHTTPHTTSSHTPSASPANPSSGLAGSTSSTGSTASPSSNGDKSNYGTIPGVGPGSRTS